MREDCRIRVAELTKDEFADAMREGRWILLPLGTVEQHGPHLALGTDLIYAERICELVAREVNALVAPALPYGVCRSMRNFPGTISITPQTLMAVLREVLAEYARHGGRRFALISGHAETAQLEAMRDAALSLLTARPDVTALVIGPYDFLDPIRKEAGLVGADGHAGSIETSQMLALAPEDVRIDRMPAVTRPRLSRFLVTTNPEREYPTGVRGDTSKASRALGERTVRHCVGEIVRVLQNVERNGTEW